MCTDEETRQKYAVKILPKVRNKQQPQKTMKKLEREVTLMARVSRQSTGITSLIDVHEDKNYVYIVMGLNEGGDLEQLLEVSVLGHETVPGVLVQLSGTLPST